MKRLATCVRILAVSLALGAAFATAAPAAVSFAQFQTRLAPHGHWFTSSRYGNVWQPTIARPGWNPYYDGHWEYTDVGQTWVSDYPWGAIPYHYGTWAIEPGRGWIWVPGDTWAPSWVVFRTGPDVIGWAPVSPGFIIGASIGSGPDPDGPAFVFVPSRQFFAPRIRNCALPASRTTVIVKKTKIVTNTYRIENHCVVNRGPNVTELQRAKGRPFRPVRLESVKELGPSLDRREIRVDEGRGRNGVRAVEPTMARGMRPERDSRTDTVPARSGDSDRPGRTAYDAAEGPRPVRVAHQDVYDRGAHADRRESSDRDARAEHGASDRNTGDDRLAADVRGTNADSGARSERDVRLLASREKRDRAPRARVRETGKPAKSKRRS